MALIRSAKALKNLSVKAPIKELEIMGCNLSIDLTKDLANVVTAEIIKYVGSFSSKNDQQLHDQHIGINILY